MNALKNNISSHQCVRNGQFQIFLGWVYESVLIKAAVENEKKRNKHRGFQKNFTVVSVYIELKVARAMLKTMLIALDLGF